MRRTLFVAVSAPERDYLIRVLRSEQASWIRASEARAKDRGARSHEDQSEYVLDAVSRAESANAMAVRVKNAKTRKQMYDVLPVTGEGATK